MKKHLAVVLCLSLCGCFTPWTYTQDGAQTQGEKAIKVICQSEHNHSVFNGLDHRLYILDIDGTQTPKANELLYPESAYVAPGRHEVEIQSATSFSVATGRVWFVAEAGKSYMIHQTPQGNGVVFWTEELGTGKVVGGPIENKRP
jgi:hypothetical protein